MVHPDKCKHPRAKDAFEVIGAAHKALLDEEQRAKLAFLLDHAKGAAGAVGQHWGSMWAGWRDTVRQAGADAGVEGGVTTTGVGCGRPGSGFALAAAAAALRRAPAPCAPSPPVSRCPPLLARPQRRCARSGRRRPRATPRCAWRP